jgi:hypothetical protein
MYSSIGEGARAEVSEQVAKAKESVQQGYTALKMRMDWSSRNVDVNPKDWDIVSTVRREVGDRSIFNTTLITASQSMQSGLAGVFRTAERHPLNPYKTLQRLRRSLCGARYAGAAGEHEYTRWQFRDLIEERRLISAAQPGQMRGPFKKHFTSQPLLKRTTSSSCLIRHNPLSAMVNLHYIASVDNSSRAQEYNYGPKSQISSGDFSSRIIRQRTDTARF